MKLVLTGGPSGGKTTLASALQKQLAMQVLVAPEAASILFSGGWPRRKTLDGVQHQQVAIYFIQRELEGLVEGEANGKLIVCDRGSLDGIAYWPGPGPGTEFFSAVGSDLERETKRYDWVIHLDTAPASAYDVTNPLRYETFEEAWTINEKIKAAWAHHPQRFIISNGEGSHFIAKMHRALHVVQGVISGKSYEMIANDLAKLS